MSFRIQIVVFFSLIISGSKAQDLQNGLIPFSTASNTLNQKLTGNKYYFHSNLKGTVYFHEGWGRGTLLLENGDRYENVYMKYNTYLEELVLFNERTGAVFIVDKSTISGFDINSDSGKKEYFRKLELHSYPGGEVYFNVMYDGGEIDLIAWHKTIRRKVSMYKDARGISRNAEFRLTSRYFLVFPGDDLREISLNRRSFILLFPEQKKVMRRLFRKNRVSFGSTDDIIRAVGLIEKEFLPD